MNGIEIVITLVLARIVFPFGLILLIGEWIRRYEARYWLNL